MKQEKLLLLAVSAAGKSAFARKLSERIGVPVTHTDAIMWHPGWDYVGDTATAEALKGVAEKDKWIIEGYITKAARVYLFEKADQIIYLDYPGWFSAWRYIKRWWQHRVNPRPELPGSPERFSFKFLKLVYTKGEVWKLEKLFRDSDWDHKIVRLRTPREADSFLQKV